MLEVKNLKIRTAIVFLIIFQIVLSPFSMRGTSLAWAETQPPSFNLGTIEKDPTSITVPPAISNINKLYQAQKLLNYKDRWIEASELVSKVLGDNQHMSPEAIKKLKKVKNYISGSWLKSMWKKVVGGRYLVEPYVHAQLLLNEVIMDMRIKLNSNSDIEVKLVKELALSYFFPGKESAGEIVFPEDVESYSNPLYSLTQEALDASMTGRPDEEKDSRLSMYQFGDLSKRIGEALKNRVEAHVEARNRIDDLNEESSDEDSRSRSRYSSRRGDNFEGDEDETVEDVVEAEKKQILDELTAEDLKTLTEELTNYYKESRDEYNRRFKNNKFLPWSLLLQLIVDPLSATYDQQLQDFRKNVFLKLKIADVEEGEEGEAKKLAEALEQKYNKGMSPVQFKLGKDPLKRGALFVLTSIGGVDMIRMRTMLMASRIMRDQSKIYNAAVKVVHWNYWLKVSSFVERVGKRAWEISKAKPWLGMIIIPMLGSVGLPGALGVWATNYMVRTTRVQGAQAGLESMVASTAMTAAVEAPTRLQRFIKTTKSAKFGYLMVGIDLALTTTQLFLELKLADTKSEKRKAWEKAGAEGEAGLLYGLSITQPWLLAFLLPLQLGNLITNKIPAPGDLLGAFNTKAGPNLVLWLHAKLGGLKMDGGGSYTVSRLRVMDVEDNLGLNVGTDASLQLSHYVREIKRATSYEELVAQDEQIAESLSRFSLGRMAAIYIATTSGESSESAIGEREEIYKKELAAFRAGIKRGYEEYRAKRTDLVKVATEEFDSDDDTYDFE